MVVVYTKFYKADSFS